MSEKNCHEYCPYSRCCYAKGSPGTDPFQCANAWRIEDILMDEKYDRDACDKAEKRENDE